MSLTVSIPNRKIICGGDKVNTSHEVFEKSQDSEAEVIKGTRREHRETEKSKISTEDLEDSDRSRARFQRESV